MKPLANILIMGLILIGTSGTALAQMNPERAQMMQERRQAMLDQRQQGPQDGPNIPGLTDEQRTAIQKLRVAHQKEMLPLRNQMGEHKAKMRSLTTAEKPDTKAINSLIDTMTKLDADMKKKQVAHRLAVREKLTDDQRVWFDTHAGKGGQKHAPMHGGKGKKGRGR